MKRDRPEDLRSLSATELCAALNSTDANVVLTTLKRFAFQIREERRIALGRPTFIEEHEEVDRGHDDNHAKKKLKKNESWKEDTAAYNVPFVGTSVSPLTLAAVVRGEWPTGLLKDYLRTSPQAVELTSDNFVPGVGLIHKILIKENRLGLSKSIFANYLRALAELVTAAIPIDRLQVGAGEIVSTIKTDEVQESFLVILLRNRLPGLLAKLAEETGNGTGKASIPGGVGPTAALVVRVLSNMSLTSVSSARFVLQAIDEQLPEGVFRLAYRLQQSKQPDDSIHQKTERLDLRVAALQLVAHLLRLNDGVIFSRISTDTTKDRKSRPGLLYLALKEGLAASDSFLSDLPVARQYLKALIQVLGLLWRHLCSPHSRIHRQKLVDLFCLDAIGNVCKLAAKAPSLPTTVILDKFFESDLTEDSDYAICCSSARRIVFLCLGNRKLSPYLRHLGRKSKDSDVSVRALGLCVTSLVESQSNSSLEKLVVECVQREPLLFPIVLQNINFPDPSQVFAYVSRVNFVSKMYLAVAHSCERNAVRDSEAPTAREAMVPIRLRKQTIIRALKTPSHALVTWKTLDLLTLVVSHVDCHVTKPFVSLDLLKWMPDVSFLVSCLTDPRLFGNGGDILGGSLCTLLSGIFKSDLTLNTSVCVEVAKILPKDYERFSGQSLLYQLRFLRLMTVIQTKVRCKIFASFL